MRQLHPTRWLAAVALALWMVLGASPAQASSPPAPAAHSDDAHAEDPAAGDHGDAHGEEGDHGGGHHVDYTGDDDHDGVPNWRDGDSSQTHG